MNANGGLGGLGAGNTGLSLFIRLIFLINEL